MAMLFGGLSMNIMGDRKSLDLFRKFWVNLASNQRYSRFTSDKDRDVFCERLENEGLPFLTIALPSIGKALDSFHADGVWRCPSDFASTPDGIPLFLGNAVRFALLGDSLAVDCVRQLAFVFYKLEVDYDPELCERFLASFENTDRDLLSIDWSSNEHLVDGAKRLINSILCKEDPTDIRPCHGSGSTACRTSNHEKWPKLRYYPKLDAEFSYPDYFFYSYSHLNDEYERLSEAVESSPTARIVLVPKDSRGPRVISCEPAELMFIQQGLMRKLYRILETNVLTAGYINFVDQGVNQRLARWASQTGRFATLDLTDASDRVSLELVRRIFPPRWVRAFEACRSERTVLPNGREVELNKFAPMGSACCFPVEAMCFWALACASLRIEWGRTKHSNRHFPEVYVYGDDIICPTNDVGHVIGALEAVGLKVNRAKTFVRGPFRESCGGDYHLGVDVTPVRVRKAFNSSDSSFIIDVDLCNNLIAKFGEADSRSCTSIIEECHELPFPRSHMPLPGVLFTDRVASNDVFYRRRWNYDLQRIEHRIPQASSPALARREPDWIELLRKELTRGIDDGTSGKYGNPLRKLEAPLKPGYYVDPHSTVKKWGWAWLGTLS